MPRRTPLRTTGFAVVALLAGATLAGAQQATEIEALYLSATGWVEPGETYPFTVRYRAGAAGASAVTISVVLPPEAELQQASPSPTGGDGSAAAPLTFEVGALAPGAAGRIVVEARALDLTQDPTILWKDLSATASLDHSVGGLPQPTITSTTLGPKVTTLSTARYGVRPFPLVVVEYQDVTHCAGAGDPYPECGAEHTAAALDVAVNSRTTGSSLWQLYNDMSFGQLQPVGEVRPEPGTGTVPFEINYPFKWSELQPSGFCSGTTLAGAEGTLLYPNRVEDGWYVLPGTQGYYGSDRFGHGLGWAVTGLGLIFGIDDGCGPTAKITYDAAAIADPDLDYNDFDTDKDGVVDFFNVAFAGDGGNGTTTVTGVNNVWPHKSDLQGYFVDENGERGYVSNDQLKSHTGEPLFWTTQEREEMTTVDTGIPVWVRVGPYNVNPEAAIEAMSVIAHEYGHSLGMPDFYSVGNRGTFGSWELMASDHAQFMTVFPRQELGWIVPREAEDGVYTLRESKIDTGEIHWKTEDGTPYTLTGPGIHNADALRVDLPKVLLIDEVPSGTRAWHSGSGNEFGCSPGGGHNLDVWLPDLASYPNASSITLSFQSLYEIEWDWDYGFVLASIDGGQTWQSLPSQNGTTISGYNPNAAACFTQHDNGITGVSGLPNALTTTERHTGTYPAAAWIEDSFDLTAFAGEQVILRFSYFTDPALAKRGWFIDDLSVTADGVELFGDDFEQEDFARLFPTGWSRISSADGVTTDHAYYVELRDRVSWDFDSKGQSERGAPTWEPGVAIVYTDENHGYGNVGVDNPPAQTIVDSQPQPGNDNPGLDDAAFNLKLGRSEFDGCTHVDNYATPDGDWKLPDGFRMQVQDLVGLSTDGTASAAEATLVVDVGPDCSFLREAPVLSFGPGHEDPDSDGEVELTWTRPGAAVGPDPVQEATFLGTLIADDAESGAGNWTVAADDPLMVPWQQSPAKSRSGTYSFWTVATDDVSQASSTLTWAAPISIPAVGRTELSFWESFGGELDDLGFVEVSEDGVSWDVVYQVSRPVFADEADAAAEPLAERRVDLTSYAGLDVQLRFRYWVDDPNYIFYTPLGWYVDDVAIETANWYDVAAVDGTSYLRTGLEDGAYHYRVRTAYPMGVVTQPSPWSNTVSVTVENAGAPPTDQPDLVVASIEPANKKGNGKAPVTVTVTVVNQGDAGAPETTLVATLAGDGAVSRRVPILPPGGSATVTFQWHTKGLADGSYTIEATADAGAEAVEADEANNGASRTVTLSGGRV